MNDQPDELVLIDRLAAGELDEPSRRQLLAWLDRDPVHWRRCALALLEAREIEQAFAAWHGEPGKSAVKPPRPSETRRPRSRAILVLAASILVAFCLGLFARGLAIAPVSSVVGVPHPSSHQTPADVTENSTPPDPIQPPDTLPDQMVAAAPVPAGSIPPYVRSQWERHGYELISHPARLPVVLPDGRRVTVPVDQLQLNYVGRRTY
jgi:hypothetical protein